MKTIDPTLLAHLQQEVTTLCWCWRITRTDGVILGFTNLDSNLVIDGVTYIAATGFTPSALATDNTMAVNNLEISSVLNDASIKAADLIGGRFDYARVDIFLVNYLDLPTSLSLNPPKHLLLVSGVLGQVKNSDHNFTAEVRSKAQFLSQKSNNQTSKLCRYDLGDIKCTVDLAPFTHLLTVGMVVNQRIFTLSNFTQIDGYFDGGNVTFTSGANDGLKAMVASYTDATRTISLFEPLPYQLEAGDTLIAIAGCRKTTQDCYGRFSNVLNFGGEESIPGVDIYLKGAL